MNTRKSDKIGKVFGDCKVLDSKRINGCTKYLLECQKCKTRFWKCKVHSLCHVCGNGALHHNARGWNRDPLYFEYHSILRRLKGHEEYKNVPICEEWENDFIKFRQWAIENGYQKGLQIDRIDNDGDYSPSNCRWVDRKTQSNNKSTNIVLEYNGKTQTLQQWSEETGISVDRLYYRYHAGKSAEEILKKYDVKNIGYTRVDVTEEAVLELRKQGMSISKMANYFGCSQTTPG
jgi:uncharacterized protein (DUF433 family)